MKKIKLLVEAIKGNVKYQILTGIVVATTIGGGVTGLIIDKNNNTSNDKQIVTEDLKSIKSEFDKLKNVSYKLINSDKLNIAKNKIKSFEVSYEEKNMNECKKYLAELEEIINELLISNNELINKELNTLKGIDVNTLNESLKNELAETIKEIEKLIEEENFASAYDNIKVINGKIESIKKEDTNSSDNVSNEGPSNDDSISNSGSLDGSSSEDSSVNDGSSNSGSSNSGSSNGGSSNGGSSNSGSSNAGSSNAGSSNAGSSNGGSSNGGSSNGGSSNSGSSNGGSSNNNGSSDGNVVEVPSTPAIASGWKNDIAQQVISTFATGATNNTDINSQSVVMTPEHYSFLVGVCNDWVNGAITASQAKDKMESTMFDFLSFGQVSLTKGVVASFEVSGLDATNIANTIVFNYWGGNNFIFCKVYYDSSRDISTVYIANGVIW